MAIKKYSLESNSMLDIRINKQNVHDIIQYNVHSIPNEQLIKPDLNTSIGCSSFHYCKLLNSLTTGLIIIFVNINNYNKNIITLQKVPKQIKVE